MPFKKKKQNGRLFMPSKNKNKQNGGILNN